MLGDYQKYEVTVKFTYEAEVFPEDPDDVFELAKLEEATVRDTIKTAFEEVDFTSLSVEPFIEVVEG